MNRYVIIGIVAIAIGTIVMTGLAQKPAWMIVGGVINGLGLFVMTAGSLISGRKDKAEIMDRIRGFREEIGAVKKAIPIGESLEAVERIENEFSEWAGTFVTNVESKIIERQKGDILLRESEINLNRKWRHVYEYVIETLRQMLTAYNQKADNKIEFTIPDLPSDLFGEEAQSFRGIIAFDHGSAWAITLQIVRPYKKEEIPNIVVHFYRSESSDQDAKTLAQVGGGRSLFLILATDPKEERIELLADRSDMQIGDIKTYYSIKASDYKSDLRELLTTLIEYQLVSLVHQKGAKGSV
jgi:hypothetical protein